MKQAYPTFILDTKDNSEHSFLVCVPDMEIFTEGDSLADAIEMARQWCWYSLAVITRHRCSQSQAKRRSRWFFHRNHDLRRRWLFRIQKKNRHQNSPKKRRSSKLAQLRSGTRRSQCFKNIAGGAYKYLGFGKKSVDELCSNED